MEKVKKLTVPQICILGIAAIWAFITLLALFFCIYANRRSRRETEETGRLARGHWRDDETAIQFRRVSEPFIRRARAPPINLPSSSNSARNPGGVNNGMAAGYGLKETSGVKHPGRAYHSNTQRGGAIPAPPTRNIGRSGGVKGDKSIGQIKQVISGAKVGAGTSHEERKGEGQAVLPKKELKRIPRR